MRIALVTSRYLTPWKRQIIDGLGERLVGLAVVPLVPSQVGCWRHLHALVCYAWPRDMHRMALHAAAWRLAPLAEVLIRPRRPWTHRTLARRDGLSYLAARGIDDPRLRSWLASLDSDLVVSMQSHRVHQELLELPRLGWLNLHHGRLPEYRGAFSVFWAMVNGESALYVTGHLMGSKLDQGPIVVEEPIVVSDGATVEQMEYLAWSRSPEVVLRAVARLEKNPAGFLPPVRSGGRFYTYPTRSDLRAAKRAGIRLR